MGDLIRRLRYLWNRRRLDAELAADLEVHREMAALSGGAPLGNSLRLREEAREAWGWMWLDRLQQDLRYAARVLAKSPGFTLAAILMLAIGTGVNIGAFGFFDFLVLRPLNVRDPGTLLRFHRRSPQNYSFVLPYPEMSFIRDYSRTLSSVLALNATPVMLEKDPHPLHSQFVTANWFRDLGATAAAGRLFDPETDDRPSSPPVVVLSHRFWLDRFGGDPSVVGGTIRLNQRVAAVIGVASPSFTGLSLDAPDLWIPLGRQPFFAQGSTLLTDFSDGSSGVEVWGRLRPGATPRAAYDELRVLAAELYRQHPREIWKDESIPGEPSGYAESLLIRGRRGTGVEERDDIYPIAAIVGTLTLLILAVACANLGSLMLARGIARDREIAIRLAVGAGRGRLVRQLLTESFLLALLGSLAGLAGGYLLLRALMRASGSPAWLDPTPDWRILAFAFGIACSAALLFGLTPALQITRRRHRATRMRQTLIGAQVAASCILLIVAGLLVRALDHALSNNPGFSYRTVIAVDPALGNHGATPAQAVAYAETLRRRIGGIAGVESISFTTLQPFGHATITAGLQLEGRTMETLVSRVEPEYFRTMRIPLLAGRNLLPGEKNAVLVSRSLANRLWPTGSALGKPLPLNGEVVVGIAGDARVMKLEDPDVGQLYYALQPGDLQASVALVRVSGPPQNLLPVLSPLVKSIDPTVIPGIELLQDALRRKVEAVQYAAWAAGALGITALAIACFGLLGVVAYSVSQRTREIGIRMALGARESDIVSATLRQIVVPVFLGLAAGVGGAVCFARILRRVLYGISALDPAAFGLAVMLFALTAAVAAWIPAHRALRIDPMQALRCE